MIGKWRNKQMVTYISTQYDNEMVQTTNRRNQKRTLPKPIMYYNSHMKGTDRLDQMVSYYPCERKTLRWQKNIFVHFLQVVIVNSLYLYNMYNSDRLSLYDIRVCVLEDLLPPKEAPLLITPTRNSMHSLSKLMKRKGNGKSVTRRCRICYQEGKCKETVYYCAVCPDEPGLCELGCCDKYHEDK
uniref:PiggyBac transposable element-derived protein domain-containing protein n=1 Tax=Cuerna arida TaxID=1464854 RepID=A0A1B6GN37_9HEMI